jgi:nucleotide-binding universal stress UspA family protein
MNASIASSLGRGPYFFADLSGTRPGDEQLAIDRGEVSATRIDYVGRLRRSNRRLLVRAQPGGSGWNQDARLRGAVAVYKKILVAYDDPESGTLARAADLAEETKATLIVTNVVAPVERSEVNEADREARERLDEADSYLKRRGLSGELVSSVGPPAEAILRLAKERQVDLLVVGTRKKGFFERLVEGSVAQNVLRGASCDVLVVY